MKCPKCGSQKIKKEYINAKSVGADISKDIDTGDRICTKCGYIGPLSEFENENFIKQTCKELNLTYKQLGELIGYSESAVNNAARQEKISEPLKRAIELYTENLKLQKELQDFRTLKEILSR